MCSFGAAVQPWPGLLHWIKMANAMMLDAQEHDGDRLNSHNVCIYMQRFAVIGLTSRQMHAAVLVFG